ncbi:acyl carrier protein [Pseudoalteromonas luteoviolacea]|uniref:Acyl carrier protein n=1 Tax=Pseudoalteromonas luteoviolacea TaxID=43657 RepID=A0A1C0TK07_9GAMM|nr:acyl carrier protein [Pseudoalteromonas luteoviolacea]MBQ4813834.1 acyl carrier protein [Pseudoalteromonas luteoviolacea]OCQ18825.1 acyl carrier protein [Pseudoalteromonas luteoviolacea]
MEQQQIFEIIVNNTKELLPELESHNFSQSDSLRDLGANSVDRSELIMMTLEEMDANIPMAQMAKANNIGELAQIMFEQQA